MLKIPKKVEYAILALKYIAENEKVNCINTRLISKDVDIPYDLTAKILQQLKRNEIILSKQGARGGYSLNVSPEHLNISRIMNAVDEEILLTNCLFEGATSQDCERIESCCLRNPLNKIQIKINELFNNTFLNEIMS